MGRAYAHALAARGAKVVVMDYGVAALTSEGHDAGGREILVADEIRAAGGEAIGVNGNVCSDDDGRRAVEAALDAWGRIDILVNNAGQTEVATMVYEEPGPYLDDQLAVHVRGQLIMARAAWSHFERQNYGRILNTGSGSAFGWGDDLGRWKGSYTIAKSAVFGITRQLAGAGASRGIMVNAVMPWAWSRMVSSALGGTAMGEWMERHLTPERVVQGALLLLHRDCPVNGQFISSAGGRVARIIFATPEGYYNPDVTPEDVLANWSQVAGDVDEHGNIRGMIELAGSREEWSIFRKYFPD
jgi:NAD(P)-dependent dehydrogenase (short-subunit alcohol dehydrogenase family)